MGKKRKVKKKASKPRNWIAVAAWDRNSAGPIKDAKKERSKNKCRKTKRKKAVEDE
jgi:hypothetical protein